MALIGAQTTICDLKAFMWLETNPATQLQVQGANSKNRTIRIIVIKIVFHHGELVNVSQSEAIEASGASIAWIILFMCLVKWVTLVLMSRRRQWHPTPVLFPGKSHGQRSLVGCSPWGLEQSDTTERLHFHFSLSWTGEGNGNPLQCSCLEYPRDGGAC